MIGIGLALAIDIVVLFAGLRYLRSRPVDVTPASIAATLPWFGIAGFLYALQQSVTLPALVDPFAGVPSRISRRAVSSFSSGSRPTRSARRRSPS